MKQATRAGKTTNQNLTDLKSINFIFFGNCKHGRKTGRSKSKTVFFFLNDFIVEESRSGSSYRKVSNEWLATLSEKIKQTTKTMSQAPQAIYIATSTLEEQQNYKIRRTATLLGMD